MVDRRVRECHAHRAVRALCGDVEVPACAGVGRREEADVGTDRSGAPLGLVGIYWDVGVLTRWWCAAAPWSPQSGH